MRKEKRREVELLDDSHTAHCKAVIPFQVSLLLKSVLSSSSCCFLNDPPQGNKIFFRKAKDP